MTSRRLFYGFDAEELFDPQPPIARESLLSWVARNAIENALPNITTILRDVGQCHRNKMTDVIRKDIDAEGLAVILGSDLPTVKGMRGEDVGEGRMTYLGAAVRHGDVHTEVRRFAPAALRSDRRPFYRASWLLRTFPVCAETWQVLRSTCDCGASQTWATVSTITLCENCGGDLRELDADQIPAGAHSGLRLLADVLFGDEESRAAAMARLPADLQDLDPGDVFELALLMARVVDPAMGNPRELVWRDEPLRLALALSRAGDLLPTWPATPWLALEAAGDPRLMHPRSTPLISLYRVLSREWATSVAAPVADLIAEIHDGITLDGDDGSHALVDLNDAARIVRMSKKDIRAARAAGHMGSLFVIRRGEILPGYERSRLEAIAAVNRWPAAYTSAKHLGIPPYGLEQLCAMDEVVWARAPHRTIKGGLHVDPRDAADIASRLRSSARPISELREPVPLSDAMRGIGGREKPWGPVVRALLEGELTYALGHTGNVLREILVEAADVDDVREMSFDPAEWPLFGFSRHLNQNDACDVLNVPLRSRGRIERHKVCDRGGAWIFDRSAVVDLAARIVTSSELSVLNDLSSKATLAWIRSVGIDSTDFGYERCNALTRLDASPRPGPVRASSPGRRP